MMRLSIAAAILVMFLCGCSQHLGNFTALSTSAYRGENINSKTLVKPSAVGKTDSLIILGFPIGGLPKVDQAVSEALSKNNGDFMANSRLYQTGWSILLVGQIGYRVEGDVYKTSN